MASPTPMSELCLAVSKWAEEVKRQAEAGEIDGVAYVVEYSNGAIGHGVIGGFADGYAVAGHLDALNIAFLDTEAESD